MSQAVHVHTAIVLVLLQSLLPRLAELFTVVVNAEGALELRRVPSFVSRHQSWR